MRILMLTEGTYPYFKGGVSTWTHDLIGNLKDFDFIVAAILPTPFYTPRYNMPSNVLGLLSIPLWGMEMVKEFSHEPLREAIQRRLKTKESEIRDDFAPYLRDFLRTLKGGGTSPKVMAEALYGMHLYLREHDYKKAFKSKHVWRVFWEELAEDPLYGHIDVSSLIETSRVIQHLLRILAYRFPEVDLCHSSAAAFCGIPAVLLKMEYDVPYLLTEHGVYFRERALDAVRGASNIVEKILWMNLFRAIVRLNYHYADKILPVCHFNVDWEKELGVPADKIEVIYNGVDLNRFKPMNIPQDDVKRIVVMARIDKLKDILNIIDAMETVSEKHGDAVCEIYGPVDDEIYYEQCLNRVEELGLENHVRFMGPTQTPEVEYNRATVVAQPSLSEGFPFSVIEAMACGKPIVATDVGGVREALGEYGIIVPPRSPRLLAKGIIKLLEDEKLREKLGKGARLRAVKLFSHERFVHEYYRVYLQAVSESRLRGIWT